VWALRARFGIVVPADEGETERDKRVRRVWRCRQHYRERTISRLEASLATTVGSREHALASGRP